MTNPAALFPSGAGLGGAPAPIRMAGKIFLPHHCGADGVATCALTANRIYYVPFWVDRLTTYAGAKIVETGATNTGRKVRLAVYAEASTGGPGALQKDFGEITLSGSAGTRTAANSIALAPGWYYLALASDSASVLISMAPHGKATSAGWSAIHPFAMMFGSFTINQANETGDLGSVLPIGDYVDGTYGAFASTAVAPTTTLVSIVAGGVFPLIALYV